MRTRIEKLVGIAAATALFLLMAVTLVDVLGRDLLNKPLLGATELTEVLLVTITFLLYPVVAWREQHIVVDLIDGISGRRLRAFQRIATALIGCGLFALVAWRMWILGRRSLEYNDVTPSLNLPTGPILLGIAVMSAVTALAFLALIPGALRSSVRASKSAPELT